MENNTHEVKQAIESSTGSSTIANEAQVDVNTQETNIQPETTVEQPSTQPVTEPGTAPLSDVDDMGVPYKNRYMEAQRKLDKNTEELREIKTILKDGQGQKREKEPTIGELRAFAQSTDNAAHQQWAYDEIHKIEKKESAELVRQELDGWKKNQETERIKMDTFNSVISRNPGIAIKDNAGNFVGWNMKDPLCQRMNFYMQNPRVSSQPDALDIAEAYALRDLAKSTAPQVNQKITEQKNQISSLQKKTLVEGGGNDAIQNVSPRQAAVDKSRSGTLKDATPAMKEILKAQGIITEE